MDYMSILDLEEEFFNRYGSLWGIEDFFLVVLEYFLFFYFDGFVRDIMDIYCD